MDYKLTPSELGVLEFALSHAAYHCADEKVIGWLVELSTKVKEAETITLTKEA